MTPYWPWWLGAAALASIAIGFRAAIGRPLGVSGMYARILRWREERRTIAESDALKAALLEATRQRFGDAALPEGGDFEEAVSGPLPSSHAALFVLCLFLGGALSHLLGGAAAGSGLGPEFASIVGSGARASLALLVGGFLVGFGTRMAGGCTSGHGLNGCARLHPASLAATAAFFGAAVAMSFALGAL